MKQNKYDNWFRRTRGEFCPIADQFAGRPIVYVEIGNWAGASLEYVCLNVLTHPESIAVGIDPYDQALERARWDVAEIKEIAKNRVAAAIGDRGHWIYEPSETGLLKLPAILKGRSIDLLYIDGQHEAPNVLLDFLLAWPHLKDGSIVIFDDYVKKIAYHLSHVRHAVAAIELCFAHRVRPFHIGRQYALEVMMHKLPGVAMRHSGQFPVYPNLAIPEVFPDGRAKSG